MPAMVYWAEQAVMRYPMDAELVAKLISGFSQLNQPQNGIECALKYFEVDSTSIEVNRALENAYFMDFQFDKAADMGERLLVLGDSVFTTLFLTGLSYSKQDSLEQAYSLLLKAATVNEFRNDACVSRLGKVCLKMERYDEGLEYLNIAKKLIYPDTLVMRSFTLSLAEANYMTGHPQEAIDAWEQHVRYNPNTLATYYNIANAYAYLLDDISQAKTYYNLFLERAKAEENPTPQLLEMIERAENMTRELPLEELENSGIPIDKELKQDSISNEEIPNDSIKIGF
jgi:tetratricopeptide (TPR) repeat protein